MVCYWNPLTLGWKIFYWLETIIHILGGEELQCVNSKNAKWVGLGSHTWSNLGGRLSAFIHFEIILCLFYSLHANFCLGSEWQETILSVFNNCAECAFEGCLKKQLWKLWEGKLFWLKFIFPSLKCIENCILVVGWTTIKTKQIQFRPKWAELTNWVGLVHLSCVSLIVYLVKDGRAWIWNLAANQGFISVLWTSVHQSWRCHFWIKSKMWCFVSANFINFLLFFLIVWEQIQSSEVLPLSSNHSAVFA